MSENIKDIENLWDLADVTTLPKENTYVIEDNDGKKYTLEYKDNNYDTEIKMKSHIAKVDLSDYIPIVKDNKAKCQQEPKEETLLIIKTEIRLITIKTIWSGLRREKTAC